MYHMGLRSHNHPQTCHSTLAKLFTVAEIEACEVSLDDASPKDSTLLEQKLMSLPELTPEEITQLPKKWYILQQQYHSHALQPIRELLHRHHGHLTQKSHWLQQYILICSHTKILIKCILHTMHDSLGHIGATKLYHFIKGSNTSQACGT